VALLVLAGCQAENPAVPPDPFLFGPTRVPPPATGTIAPQPGLSANRPATAAVASAPAGDPKSLAVTFTPAATFGGPVQTPAAGAAVTPVGDQVKIPDAARKLDTPGALAITGVSPLGQPATPPVSTIPPAGSATIAGSGSPGSSPASTVADRRNDPSPAGQDRVVQTLLPRSQASSGAAPLAPTGSTQPLPAPATAGGSKSGVVDIDNLPAATPTGQPQTSYRPSTIQLVSGIEEIGDGEKGEKGEKGDSPHLCEAFSGPSQQTEAGPSLPDSRYGYDPQYGWLRGKLEFSESDRHWKLRYIPIDGVTDNFGGSVVLMDTPLLSGYERGDFVEAAGKLISASPDKRGYAPKYEVSQLKRLAN
jgi:hypothetical protein